MPEPAGGAYAAVEIIPLVGEADQAGLALGLPEGSPCATDIGCTGYVASNDTPDGRQQNRRGDARVTAK